ncbi:MAG: twin-arginine translocase subunit TatC [Bacteroidota bacterium]
MAKGKDQNPEVTMSLLEHLEVLRWHLIRSFISIIIVAILAFLFHGIIFDKILLAPMSPEFITNKLFCVFGKVVNTPALCINASPFNIINIQMSGQFVIHITVSIIAGFIIAFPYIIFEFWQFIKPALFKHERKHAKGFVFFSSLLFFLGVLFGYYVIVPLSVNFLGTYSVSDQVVNQINLSSYISIVNSVTLAGGIVFELPILIYFFTKIGLITPDFLRKYRKHSLVVLLILSAIITPPDVFSQILVCFPLVILYEIGIVISKRIVKKEERDI